MNDNRFELYKMIFLNESEVKQVYDIYEEECVLYVQRTPRASPRCRGLNVKTCDGCNFYKSKDDYVLDPDTKYVIKIIDKIKEKNNGKRK